MSSPMSQDTFILIVFVCLFIMNKCRVINRFQLSDGPSVRKICKENNSSFRKVIEEQPFNYLLNYFILIVAYNIIISRPLFLGISELNILYLLHYGCTILYHGKRSHRNAIIRIYMYTCWYTINIKLYMTLYNAFMMYVNLNDTIHILIRKQYIMINYEMISTWVRQVKHIIFFLISQCNTEI